MDSKERRLIIVLLSIAFMMMLSGFYFIPFVVHVWTYIANVAGDKDMFLASVLLVYFVMFGLIGAAVGLLINSYGSKIGRPVQSLVSTIVNRAKKRSN